MATVCYTLLEKEEQKNSESFNSTPCSVCSLRETHLKKKITKTDCIKLSSEQFTTSQQTDTDTETLEAVEQM